MTIEELCGRIGLQEEVTAGVMQFSCGFDFESVRQELEALKKTETSKEALEHLQASLGEDAGHVKILSCMLQCACEAYKVYRDLSINDEIFYATMKCFTRFIGECAERTGEYAFDREWWTARQVGCTLFRIGELEYEMVRMDGRPAVSIHIPSDAGLSPEKCSASILSAKGFFTEHFPAYKDSAYICDSWLLSPVLAGMLRPESNIAAFQRRFEIIDVRQPDTEFLEWLYHTYSTDYAGLPENTSLQRSMKRHLLAGGEMSSALGVLRN